MLDANRRAGGGFGCSGDKVMLKDCASTQGKSAEASEILEGQRADIRDAQ